jgi:hypothetical protein
MLEIQVKITDGRLQAALAGLAGHQRARGK